MMVREKEKVSVISTVLNEEDSICNFLDSIVNQTRIPNEFIIVDGGSNDRTLDIIEDYSKKHKWIRIYRLDGSNIPKARNYAIKKAKNDIIAVCDAGNKYDKSWLENLMNGFDGNVGFGLEKAWIKNEFQSIISKKLFHKKKPNGSSKNMIFSKKVWFEVGGYPEDLNAGEDTIFELKIKKKGYDVPTIPDAVSYWEMRKDIEGLRKQFYWYGYWDGISYRKYKMLPKRHIFAVMLLTPLLLLYPIGMLFSWLSISFKIDLVRRYEFIKGFWKGFLGLKEK